MQQRCNCKSCSRICTAIQAAEEQPHLDGTEAPSTPNSSSSPGTDLAQSCCKWATHNGSISDGGDAKACRGLDPLAVREREHCQPTEAITGVKQPLASNDGLLTNAEVLLDSEVLECVEQLCFRGLAS